MKPLVSLVLIFALITISTAGLRAQEPAQKALEQTDKTALTNADVMEMIKSGLSTEIITAKIRTSTSKFDTAPATLADLKAAGVAEAVIMAMVNASAPATVQSVTEAAVKVPDGTEIEIQLINNMSGQEVKVGDLVDFTIVRTVEVGGVTVFERDASARARITTAKKSGRWGKAGKLEWAMQDVQAIGGDRVPARFKKREAGDSKGGTVAVAAVASALFVGPFALLWGLKKGRPAIIPAGNRYTVFIDGDMTIKGKVLTTAKQSH